MPVEPISLLQLKPGDTNDPLDRRYTDRLRKTIADAKELARSRGDTQVTPEHIFLCISDNGCANAILDGLGLSLIEAQHSTLATLPKRDLAPSAPDYSDSVEVLFETAKDFARSLRHKYLGDEHVLWALVAVPSSVSSSFQNLGLTADAVQEKVLELLGLGLDG